MPAFADAAYDEARHRIWSRLPGEFAAPDLPLLWWDETIGDEYVFTFHLPPPAIVRPEAATAPAP